MAKRVSRLIAFEPSDSMDVEGYKVYWGPAQDQDGNDTVLNNDPSQGAVSPGVNIGIPPTRVIDGEELHVFAIADVPQLRELPDGQYDFGVAAYDSSGQESDIVEAEDVTLDLMPPNPPGKVVVISAP